MTTYWAYCCAAIRTRCKSERGASLVEYALLLTFIVFVCIAAVRIIGSRTNDSFTSSGSSF
ncbi:MAG: Flp family type IVb pilin [Actinomycetota bacterium]|nr:Flp family type IVb pilin [Actinomycetota bacterium]